jgi:enoyl-CoA hydratase/carnithine racemase
MVAVPLIMAPGRPVIDRDGVIKVGGAAPVSGRGRGSEMAHEVRLDREGTVATITLANPPRHTMTATMVGELDARVGEVESDPSVRVLVLTGGGDGVFIAHYEVEELADSADRQQGRSDDGAARPGGAGPRLHPYNALMRRLEGLPQVTVAAVNGNAAGGGCELALACDFRLLADGRFRFGLPETSVGIIPGAGGTQRLTRLLGEARALDLVLHATLLSPADALALGLVHRVLPAERFPEEVQAFAEDLAARAPVALAAAKRAIRGGADLPLDEGLLLEQQEFGRCLRSEDAAGAMRAALRGERYTFQGR